MYPALWLPIFLSLIHISLLFKLDDQIDVKFEADKDDAGNFKPSSVKLSFKNNLIDVYKRQGVGYD